MSRRKVTARIAIAAGIAMAIVVTLAGSRLYADAVPAGWTGSHTKAIGYSDLAGRGGAFKMAIREVNGRWYLYMGHLWHRGWSIVDVTDPASPTFVKFVPWPTDNTWTIQMELHGNLMITALERQQAAWGGDLTKPFDEGVVLWDISDPVNPKQLSQWKTGGTGTHRNGYPGGKYAYLSAAMPGYSGYILVILDVSDPKAPKEAGRWWMPGQKDGEPPLPVSAPGIPTGIHGPAVIEGNRAYLGYGPAVVILDITNVAAPKVVGQLRLDPPFGQGVVAVHDVALIPGRSLLLANSEAVAGDNPASTSCDEPFPGAMLIDIKDETKPRLVSMLPTPAPPAGAPYTSFCDKGGRFGPHNPNLEYHLPDVQTQGDLVYLTYFNAGLRIFDIRNPRVPTEVGWFVPPTPTTPCGLIPTHKLVTQTEDVLVDRRGNIYITDKQWGLWVLRHTPDQPGTTANANRAK